MTNDVVDLMQDLYFDGPSARALLISIEYRPAQIPEFRSAATFWPEVVLRLTNGIVPDGVRRLLTQTVHDHPGNARAAALLATVNGVASSAPPAVLCLFTDPNRTSKIRLDREARLFQEMNDHGGIAVTMRHAVRTSDVISALLAAKPRILHFAGHGTSAGEVVFEDDRGTPAHVDAASFARAIAAACADPLDCVVLNSCYTAGNAEAFRGATKAVAGCVTDLKDQCALAFAQGFYTGVGAGQAVERAYETGRAAVDLAGGCAAGLHFVSFGR